MSLRHDDIGHQNVIAALAFSPDGSRLLTGSWDGTAKLWDVTQCALLRTFAWGSGQVNAVAWSPDGATLAVAGDRPDEDLNEVQLASYQDYFDHHDMSFFESGAYSGSSDETRLFDSRSGSLLRIIRDAGAGVTFSPDGRTLAVVSHSSLVILDLADGTCLARFDDENLDLRNVIYSTDGRSLACVAMAGVWVFDSQTAALEFITTDPHLFEGAELGDSVPLVKRLADPVDYLDPDEVPAYAARFWQSLLSRFRPTALTDHGMERQRVTFAFDGSQAAVLGEGCVTVLQKDDHGVERQREFRSRQCLRTCAFSPDGRLLAAAGNPRVVLWDLQDGHEVARIGDPPTPIVAVAFSPRAPYVAAGDSKGTVFLCDSLESNVLVVDQAFDTPIAQVTFSPNGDSLVVGSRDGRVRIVDPVTLQTRREFRAHAAGLAGCAYTADGAHLVSVGYAAGSHEPHAPKSDAEMIVWSLFDGRQCGSRFLGEDFQVTSLSVSPDRMKLAIASWREIMFVDLSTEIKVPLAIRNKAGGFSKIAFVGDSLHLLVANGYGMHLIDLDQRTNGKWFFATRDGPTDFAVSKDGRMLARSTAYFHEIELFDVTTGKLKKYFLGHQNSVHALALSSDDRLLASGGADGTLKIWDFHTGRLIASHVLLPNSCGSSMVTGDRSSEHT